MQEDEAPPGGAGQKWMVAVMSMERINRENEARPEHRAPQEAGSVDHNSKSMPVVKCVQASLRTHPLPWDTRVRGSQSPQRDSRD